VQRVYQNFEILLGRTEKVFKKSERQVLILGGKNDRI